MNFTLKCLVFLSVAVALAWGAEDPLQQCPGSEFENLKDLVSVTPCGRKRCNLVKKSNITVQLIVIPDKEIHSLTNDVSAVLFGIRLPFIGVSGTDASPDVVDPETNEKATWPLQPKKKYVYTKYVPVLDLYPEANMDVIWSLNEGKKSVICFQMLAAISKPKHTKS